MRISGLLYRVLVCLAIFSAYAFAQTVAVAHIIYEGNVLYYADNESNFVYKAVEKNSDGTFTIEFTNERLANGKKDVRRLQFGVGCNGNTCHTDLSPDNKPLLGELFPGYKENVTNAANIEKQEVWIVINEDKTLTISDTKPVVAVKPQAQKAYPLFDAVDKHKRRHVPQRYGELHERGGLPILRLV